MSKKQPCCSPATHDNFPIELLAFSCHIDLLADLTLIQPPTPLLVTCQVLEEAAAIDAKAAAGQSITPLCGLPLAVKVSQAYHICFATAAIVKQLLHLSIYLPSCRLGNQAGISRDVAGS